MKNKENEYMDVMTTIDNLKIAPSWKEKFKAISEAGPVGGGFGHEFENKAKYKALPFWTKFSGWGLLFGIFFYLFKGMWKKAISIMALMIVIEILIELFPKNDILVFASYILPTIIVFAQANIDYYRKMVLGENFWW